MRRHAASIALLVVAAGTALAADAPIRLPRPPFPPAAGSPAGGGTQLVLVSSRVSRGAELAWVRRNGLDLREFAVPGAINDLPMPDLPATVQRSYRGLRLVRAIRQRRTLLLVYGRDFASGRILVAQAPSGRVRYAFDFVAYGGTQVYQQIVWAAEAGGTVFVETAHSTYARSTGGRNAYMTAIDIETGRRKWRSPALVANADRFELFGDVIVTGYGFTAEPDYLYLLDRGTGRPLARLGVPTAPDLIVRKRNRVYVRTYDHDLVLKLA